MLSAYLCLETKNMFDGDGQQVRGKEILLSHSFLKNGAPVSASIH